jgi:excisionase family DNA binding protein
MTTAIISEVKKAGAPTGNVAPEDGSDSANVKIAKDAILVRVATAARMIDVSRSRMYELIEQGVVPCVRLGGTTIRVPMAALRGLAESVNE